MDLLFISSKPSWYNLIYNPLKFSDFHPRFTNFQPRKEKWKSRIYIYIYIYIYIWIGSHKTLLEGHERMTVRIIFSELNKIFMKFLRSSLISMRLSSNFMIFPLFFPKLVHWYNPMIISCFQESHYGRETCLHACFAVKVVWGKCLHVDTQLQLSLRSLCISLWNLP